MEIQGVTCDRCGAPLPVESLEENMLVLCLHCGSKNIITLDKQSGNFSAVISDEVQNLVVEEVYLKYLENEREKIQRQLNEFTRNGPPIKPPKYQTPDEIQGRRVALSQNIIQLRKDYKAEGAFDILLVVSLSIVSLIILLSKMSIVYKIFLLILPVIFIRAGITGYLNGKRAQKKLDKPDGQHDYSYLEKKYEEFLQCQNKLNLINRQIGQTTKNITGLRQKLIASKL
jgi:hypothetical protein